MKVEENHAVVNENKASETSPPLIMEPMPLQQGINPLACIFPQEKKRLHSDSVVLLQKRLRSIIVLPRVD